MDYKFKYLKYKTKCDKLEKKIYEYIEKNNIDIKNVYNLVNLKNNIDNVYKDDDDNLKNDEYNNDVLMMEIYKNSN